VKKHPLQSFYRTKTPRECPGKGVTAGSAGEGFPRGEGRRLHEPYGINWQANLCNYSYLLRKGPVAARGQGGKEDLRVINIANIVPVREEGGQTLFFLKGT